MQENINNLDQFIQEEKAYFSSLNTKINWDDLRWDAKDWLPHRGGDSKIIFTYPKAVHMKFPEGIITTGIEHLSCVYTDFSKSIAAHMYRTKASGFMAIRNYVNECRRLYVILHRRNEDSPVYFTRWHFEEALNLLQEINYKNIYDVATNFQVIASVLDKKGITPSPIQFKNTLTPYRSAHSFKVIAEVTEDDKRINDEKLPSYEAMKAYAQCSNNPINNEEEILLRTIDLLIAMGQRGNEVMLIPYDCWVEREVKGKKGDSITDASGNVIKEVGIRYYAEKSFQSRVHWLAQPDIPFALRAVTRLSELTQDVREIAKWQENNPGRLWQYSPNEIVPDFELIKLLGFKNTNNLNLYLTRNNITPCKTFPDRYYKAGDIERFLLPKLSDHAALKEQTNGTTKVILKTSEVLSIRFDGAFRFKRLANIFKVFPGRTTLKDISGALGGLQGIETIFERRKLKEADHSKIVLTSHQLRHWRNTIYELAGMSNVQQALAMGRRQLTQNKTYQHPTLFEQTQEQREFFAFTSPMEKITFLHDGIRTGEITGDLTNTYNFLKEDHGLEQAESFLKTHAQALHITPYGGCTHDFSQTPCLKHLQCWNGCSNLHRTNAPGETEKLQLLLQNSKDALQKIKESTDQHGAEVWILDLEKKISNLEKALSINVTSTPTPVFPEGKPVTLPLSMRKRSSVKNE